MEEGYRKKFSYFRNFQNGDDEQKMNDGGWRMNDEMKDNEENEE